MKNAFKTTLRENNSRSLSPFSQGPEFRNYTKSGKKPEKIFYGHVRCSFDKTAEKFSMKVRIS